MSEIEFIPLKRDRGLTAGESFLRRKTVKPEDRSDLILLGVLILVLIAQVIHILMMGIYPTPITTEGRYSQSEACAMALSGEVEVVEEWPGQTAYECSRVGA